MMRSGEKRQQARRMRRQGMSTREIADALGEKYITVRSWIPRPEEEAHFDRMATMRQQGYTNIEIADALGIGRHRVAAVLGPHGSRRPRKKDRRRVIVRLAENEYASISMIAGRLGIAQPGNDNRPNQITQLLEGIAAGEFAVVKK